MKISTFLVLIICLFLLQETTMAQRKQRLSVIFDTDMGPDYDDVGAIAMLHAFDASGDIKILATIASTSYPRVAPVLSVLNTYFKKSGLPIAVPPAGVNNLSDRQHWSDTLVARYPHAVRSNDEVPRAVELYRKILAGQPDRSVCIITVGFLTNLSDLLKSAADQYSPLSGKELVKRKVKKLVSMAGKFPEGTEFNIQTDAEAARLVFGNWPSPVYFTGFEIGSKIKTGLPLIENEQIQDSPVKDVFRISIPIAAEDRDGRMSWDETAVWLAVKGHAPYFDLKEGRIVVDESGRNSWDSTGRGQFYLLEKKGRGELEKLINDLIMHQPE